MVPVRAFAERVGDLTVAMADRACVKLAVAAMTNGHRSPFPPMRSQREGRLDARCAQVPKRRRQPTESLIAKKVRQLVAKGIVFCPRSRVMARSARGKPPG